MGSSAPPRKTVEINVPGIEQTTTAAGTFKAYKLVVDESWSGTGRLAQRRYISSTYFYSPETKSVIKESDQSYDGSKLEMELIKFTPGS